MPSNSGGSIDNGDYALSGGTFSFDQILNVNSQMHWNDGTLSGSGSLNVTGSAYVRGTLDLGGPSSRVSNLNLVAGLLTGTGAVTLVATNLAYGAADPNNGVNPNVTDIAYSNNVSGATTTSTHIASVPKRRRKTWNDASSSSPMPFGASIARPYLHLRPAGSGAARGPSRPR